MKRAILLVTVLSTIQLAYSQNDTSVVPADTSRIQLQDSEFIAPVKVEKEKDHSYHKRVKEVTVKSSSGEVGIIKGYVSPSGSAQGGNSNSTRTINKLSRQTIPNPTAQKAYYASGRYNQQNNPAYQKNKQDKNFNGLVGGTDAKFLTADELKLVEEKDFSSGQLTGAELSDFDKYEMWQHIADADFDLYSRLWEIIPTHRHSLQVLTGEGRPAVDIPVQLIDKNDKVLWQARTNNTGSAELWGNGEEGHKIIAVVNGKKQTLKKPTLFEEGINRMTVQMECNISDNVDIAFIVDATGSMKDEIKYLQSEMEDIIAQAKAKHSKLNFRTASVFYRCSGNDYAYKHADFAQDETSIGNFIKEQSAAQGGAEVVDSALYVGIDQLNWSEEARARIAFLFLDEPPGKDSLTKANMAQYIAQAAEKGIRIVPVVASANFGTEESLEYLMRAAALLTNSSYVFLTDDSGIGDAHAKPTVDEYQVEKLNKLMQRLIKEFTYAPACNEDITQTVEQDTLVVKDIINVVVVDSVLLAFQDSIRAIVPDTLFAEVPDTLSNNDWDYPEIPVVDEIKIWPNPTWGALTVEVKGEATEVYLADISGKIIAKYPLGADMRAKFDISENPAGIYMVQCVSRKKWLAGKVILMK